MGADNFTEEGEGASVREAFRKAVDQSAYMNGHGGYTGSLAEKHDFIEITPLEGVPPQEYADLVMQAWDFQGEEDWDDTAERFVRRPFNVEKLDKYARASYDKYDLGKPGRLRKLLLDFQHVQDKWGPAGAIAVGKNKWIFFGWASS